MTDVLAVIGAIWLGLLVIAVIFFAVGGVISWWRRRKGKDAMGGPIERRPE